MVVTVRRVRNILVTGMSVVRMVVLISMMMSINFTLMTIAINIVFYHYYSSFSASYHCFSHQWYC